MTSASSAGAPLRALRVFGQWGFGVWSLGFRLVVTSRRFKGLACEFNVWFSAPWFSSLVSVMFTTAVSHIFETFMSVLYGAK